MSENIPELVPEVYEPTFDVPENMTYGLGDRRVGQKIKAIVGFTVIERTKSYAVLRVNSLYLTPTARRY